MMLASKVRGHARISW